MKDEKVMREFVEGSGDFMMFSFKKGENLTVKMLDGEPWFIAEEVCDALRIKNRRDALTRLNDKYKGGVVFDTLGGRQTTPTVNEIGLCKLIRSSKKKNAKVFTNWIIDKVIPSIRKHGMSMTKNVPGSGVRYSSDLLGLSREVIRQNEALKEQRSMNRKMELELCDVREELLEAVSELRRKDELINGMSDMCEYGESYIKRDPDALLTFSDVAPRCENGLSAQGLMDWMQRRGIVGKRKQNGHWTILKDHHNKDYYVVDTYEQEHPDGSTSIRRTLKFTEAGAFYIVKRYKEWKARVDTAFDEKERGVYQPAFPVKQGD